MSFGIRHYNWQLYQEELFRLSIWAKTFFPKLPVQHFYIYH